MSVYKIKVQKIKKITEKYQKTIKKYDELYNASIRQFLENAKDRKIAEIKKGMETKNK